MQMTLVKATPLARSTSDLNSWAGAGRFQEPKGAALRIVGLSLAAAATSQAKDVLSLICKSKGGGALNLICNPLLMQNLQTLLDAIPPWLPLTVRGVTLYHTYLAVSCR